MAIARCPAAVATASADEAKQLDLLTPMPPEARRRVRESLHRFVAGAVIVESPGQNPVATEMLRFHGRLQCIWPSR